MAIKGDIITFEAGEAIRSREVKYVMWEDVDRSVYVVDGLPGMGDLWLIEEWRVQTTIGAN